MKNFTEFLEEYTRTANVLFIEDHPDVASVFIEILNQFYINLFPVSNGKQAVDEMSKTHMDLIFTDLKLPDISYQSLCHKIHALQPLSPVIVVSAFIDERAITSISAILARPVMFIDKPVALTTETIARIFAILKIRAPYNGSAILSFRYPHSSLSDGFTAEPQGFQITDFSRTSIVPLVPPNP